MGRLSNRKKVSMNNLRGIRTIKSVTEQIVNEIPDSINVKEETVQKVEFKIIDTGVSKREPFSRRLEYRDRYKRKLKQRNREMAKCSAKISSYFNTVEPVIEEAVLEETEMDKMKAAYTKLSSDLTPVIKCTTDLQKANSYEYSKYQAVQLYFECRIEGLKPSKASVLATKAFWYYNTTMYRCQAVRKYAEEYPAFGKISVSRQGKHSKRGLVIATIVSNISIKNKFEQYALNEIFSLQLFSFPDYFSN